MWRGEWCLLYKAFWVLRQNRKAPYKNHLPSNYTLDDQVSIKTFWKSELFLLDNLWRSLEVRHFLKNGTKTQWLMRAFPQYTTVFIKGGVWQCCVKVLHFQTIWNRCKLTFSTTVYYLWCGSGSCIFWQQIANLERKCSCRHKPPNLTILYHFTRET